LITGADFSLISAYPTNGLVTARLAPRPQAVQIVDCENPHTAKSIHSSPDQCAAE
jgi:hypothetical protein